MDNTEYYYYCYYNLSESQRKYDGKNGAPYVPAWVELARRKGDTGRMHEMDNWINYTNRVPLNRKLTSFEWPQVKFFDQPKSTLKKQVEPEHWGNALSLEKTHVAGTLTNQMAVVKL